MRARHTSRYVWLLVLACLCADAGAADWDRSAGRAYGGKDVTRLLPPAGAEVSVYENHGYRLLHRGDEVWIEVDASPVGSEARWRAPATWSDDPVGRLVRSITAGAGSEFGVASRILGWVAAHIAYELDRSQSQDPADVLERRSGYCTGFARLSVAMLAAAGLEAREVAGYVLNGEGPGEPQGFHRWVETRFSDVGWVFSDPLHSHHYVPATYVRLGSETIVPDDGLDGVLLERHDDLVAVDLAPQAPPGVRVRRNVDRQLAGALRVEVPGVAGGLAVLEGNALRQTHTLVRGATTFLGLQPGSYQLEVRVAGLPPMVREFELADRRRTLIELDVRSAAASWRTSRSRDADDEPADSVPTIPAATAPAAAPPESSSIRPTESMEPSDR